MKLICLLHANYIGAQPNISAPICTYLTALSWVPHHRGSLNACTSKISHKSCSMQKLNNDFVFIFVFSAVVCYSHIKKFISYCYEQLLTIVSKYYALSSLTTL